MHKLLGTAGVSAEVLLSPPTAEAKLDMETVHRGALPPGVTERDLEMFMKAQDKATEVSTLLFNQSALDVEIPNGHRYKTPFTKPT